MKQYSDGSWVLQTSWLILFKASFKVTYFLISVLIYL